MTKLSVIIPSRLERAEGGLFLERAVASVQGQALQSPLDLELLVGVDAGAAAAPGLAARLGARLIESEGRSQAAALNAAMAAASGDYVAFLEDDDQWRPDFLPTALSVLKDFDFVSSTQLEVDPGGQILRINDFATPSGWIMRRAVLDKIGPFDGTYRFHLDNDWLGRLGRTEFRRAHLVEATAPVDYTMAQQVRPWLANMIAWARPPVTLARHGSPWPCVIRLVHPGSGMQKVAADPALLAQSNGEYERLKAAYGDVPW
jgi:glycosyltransferase involved in cell wall biosynthesis